MSRQRDREEFVAIITAEGASFDTAEALMRYAGSLHRIAELECSSEWADRDRVPCPGIKRESDCICEHWSGCGCDGSGHHPVTRISRREQGITRKVKALCEPLGIEPVFGGDPRGAVLKLKVPSGRTNDWGNVGVCVP